ncbi:MAG: hypothetical protein K2L07_15875 [Lachnospiraceae bacterium]|nr:hypothetical protein [Lachnospiraceae bacterium]
MNDEMTLGQWIGTIVLTCIPCVNIIMLIIWAASAENVNKKRWAQAQLIVAAVLVVLSIILNVIFGAAFATVLSGMSGM